MSHLVSAAIRHYRDVGESSLSSDQWPHLESNSSHESLTTNGNFHTVCSDRITSSTTHLNYAPAMEFLVTSKCRFALVP